MKQKRWKYLWGLCVLLCSFGMATMAMAATEEKPFRVVGYYTATSFDEPLERIQVDCYTHLMYGFLKPQKDGAIEPVPKPEVLQSIVEKVHAVDGKVFAAVGGWGSQEVPLEPIFRELAAYPERRERFVQTIMDIVHTYQLDGIELDWEYPKQETEASYEALVLELASVLHAENKELSAAVAGATNVNESAAVSKMISPKALEALDFVEIMAYDLHTTEHSPLWFAKTSVEYWCRQLPADKVVLGVPLYARPSWVQYRHLVQADPENAYRNFVAAGTVSKLDSSYNGLPLLHDKAVYALEHVGGIMFFDVNEDADGEYSAVRMVSDLVKEAEIQGAEAFEKRIWVYQNGRPMFVSAVDEDAMGEPFIDGNGRTQLPVRKVAEALGVDVTYDAKTKTVMMKKGERSAILTIDVPSVVLDGKKQRLDCAPMVQNGRTYLPARVIFTYFGYQVQWNVDGRRVALDVVIPSEQ